MKKLTLMSRSTGEHNHFSEGQLRYASGITKWCVKHRDTVMSSRTQINLISTDTETSNR
jgi:hypothetical protein